MTDGVPSARTREMLLHLVCSLPDPIGEGGAIDLGRVEGLRSSLSQFAAICRRMQATDGFDLAAYDWYDKG